MVDVKRLLPIGSVIRLREAKKCLMIFGVCQEHNGKTYDYYGVLWPEGSMGGETHVLFYHDDIEEIVFEGYSTPEREAFIERLHKFYESQG